MKNTFFTSDNHAGHDNILHLCHRPFTNIREMEDTIVKNHNAIVDINDEIWDMGDVAYRCSPYHVVEFLSRFNGNRHIILGNHDKPLRQAFKMGLLRNLLRDRKITIVGGENAIYDPSLAISKMIEIGTQRIFLSHYSARAWPSAFRGVWHLYGHSHGNLAPFFKSRDVGVDANNFTPLSFEVVKTFMLSCHDSYRENEKQDIEKEASEDIEKM